MMNSDLMALSGRVEGLSRALLLMAAMLQRQGAFDEQLYQARLRVQADALPPELSAARELLTTLADDLLRDYFYLHGKTEADLQAALKPEP